MVAVQRDFLGDGEIVLRRVFPVDEPDIHGVLARRRLHRHAVAQQAVHRLVVVVQTAVGVVGLGAQPVERAADLRGMVITLGEIGGEQIFFDIAVIRAVSPIT